MVHKIDVLCHYFLSAEIITSITKLSCLLHNIPTAERMQLNSFPICIFSAFVNLHHKRKAISLHDPNTVNYNSRI